jgi:galactokinase
MRAGLSSSAAVEEAFAIAWQSLEGWRLDYRDLAQIGVEVEREYLGLGSGIQDQFTCLHARSEQVLCLDCRSLGHQHTPLPAGVKVVICDTKTRRELTGSGYNGRAQDAHDALDTIKLVHDNAKRLRDVTLDQLLEFEAVLSAGQFRRARHVVTEIARVHKGLDVLRAGDVAAFGALMNESYWSARDDYGSSSDALDHMWQAANDHPACYGARYSGGGEAGAVVALVDANEVEDFIVTVSARYEELSRREGSLFPVEPAAGAGVFI